MEILNVRSLDLLKGYFKQELHPRARDGKFAKKHEGIASPVVMEEPKKVPKSGLGTSKTSVKTSKTGAKGKTKVSTPKTPVKGKTTPKKTAQNKTELVVKAPVKKPTAKVPKPKEAKKFYRYSLGLSEYVEAVGAKEVKLKAVKGSFFVEHPDSENPNDTYIYETTTGTRIVSSFTDEKDAINHAEVRLRGWGQEGFDDKIATNKSVRGLSPAHKEPKPASTKKTTKTSEMAAPKMPPIVDTSLVRKRAPRPKVVALPVTTQSSDGFTPDFQNKGRVRVVARRVGSYAIPSMQVRGSEDVASIFADLADADREKSYVLAVKDGKVAGIHCTHIGNINSSIIDPKDMLKVALLSGADTVYLVHNHPGGKSDPSGPDKDTTIRFKKSTDNLGIKLGGHVVIGDNNFSVLDSSGIIMGYKNHVDRDAIARTEQAPVYETYQEKDKTVPERAMHGGSDVISYIKDNLSLLDADKAMYIIGADNQNVVTHAEPLDITLPPDELRKKALESLIKGNCKNFFMYTGNASLAKLMQVGINSASADMNIQLYDVIHPSTSNMQELKDGSYHYKSLAERNMLDMVKGIYIDLQKSIEAGKVTKTQAKALHKDLPPGGAWRSFHGHHIYILNGKVLAGAIPGMKGAKKATKAHLAEHQETIDQEAKAAEDAAKKAKKSTSKAKPKTGKEAIEATLRGANNKESSTKRTKVTPKFMEDQKKAVDKLANKPKPKSKKPTLAEQQAEAKKMLEPTTKSKAKSKTTSEEPVDIRSMVPDMMDPLDEHKEADIWKIPFSKFLEASKLKNPHFNMNNASFKNYHKRAVSKALAEGKTIPKEVLVEYPELTPRKSKKGEVADIHTEAQKNKTTARDVGQKVWGSKKDKASLRAEFEETPTLQGLEEIEAVSPEIAQTLCVKKNLLKPVNFEADMNRGVDVNVAMTKQLIYDRIGVKPAEDTPQGRQHYMRAMQELQRLLEPAKTWEEFRDSIQYLSDYMRKERPKDMEQLKRNLGYSIQESQKEPSEHDIMRGQWNSEKGEWNPISPKERKQRIADIKQKFKERITKDLERIAEAEVAGKAPFFPLGTKLTDFFTKGDSRQSTMNTVRAKRLTWDKYFADKQAKKKAPKKESETTTKWEKEKPAEIQRTGGRKTPVQKPEDMVKTFGFRGVEFGHYVDDKAGAFHLVKSSEALHDLADILGLKDKDISLNGKLALAFGARGSGRALAHYEPDMKTINITKGGGAGSLGHEWGHALDNILYQESIGRPSNNMAADGRMGDVGSPEIRSAYDELMHAIKVGSGVGKTAVKNKKQSFYSYPKSWSEAYDKLGLEGATEAQAKSINDSAERDKEHYKTSLRRIYPDDAQYKERLETNLKKTETKRKKNLSDMVQVMAYLHKKKTGEEPEEIQVRGGISQYFADSMMAGGGSENNYWTRPHEMFARAFETYLQDKMSEVKTKNDYLVYGAKGTREHSPYPRGEEAVQIGKAFDKLMDAVRSTGAIQKSLAMLEQWADEYAWEALKKSYAVSYSTPEELKQGTGGIIRRSDLQRVEADQSTRSAYNVPSSEGILYIPTNRLQTPYQTDKALNFDKIKENVTRMENGENLEPVTIGFNYEVHDGHHRLEASKIQSYTHVPCTVGQFNDIDKQRLYEEYSELWKSLNSDLDRDLKDEYKAIKEYKETIKEIKDPKIRKIIAEILGDEENHAQNLKKIIAYIQGDKTALEGLEKSLVYLPGLDTGLSAFPYEAPYTMFRGIGQKEYDFIKKNGYIQTKGKGNDEDQENIVTCFSNIFSQAEGYARSNYDLYHEKQAYVLAVVYRGTENELGEIEVRGKTPASDIVGIIPVPKTPIVKGLYIDLQKAFKEAEHPRDKKGEFSKKDAVHKSEKPMYTKDKGQDPLKQKGGDEKMEIVEAKGLVPREVGQSDKSMAALAKGKKLRNKLGDIHGSEDTYNAYARKVGEYKSKLGTDPHKLTYSEFYNTAREYQGFIGSDEMPLNALAKMHKLPNNGLRRDLELHYNFVKRALEEGKEVPENVIKDYPELQSIAGAKKPRGTKVRDANEVKGSKIPEQPKMKSKLSATEAKKLLGEHGVKASHREHLLNTLQHEATSNTFKSRYTDELEDRAGKVVNGRSYKTKDIRQAAEAYKKSPAMQKDIEAKAKAHKEAEAAKPKEETSKEYMARIEANQKAEDEAKRKATEDVKKYTDENGDFDPLALLMDGAKKPKEAKPAKLQYYKSNKSVGDDKLTYVPVDGKKVDVGGSVHAFMHKGAGEQGWVVTEAQSGIMLANGRTQDEVLQKATEAVSKLGSTKLAEGIAKHIAKHGESPATGTPETMGAVFKPEQPVTPYHIAVPKGKSGKAKYMPVHEHAEKVNVGKGIHAFIHGRDGDWTVSEARSGLKIISNSSKSMAIRVAKDLVERHRENFDTMVQKHIDTHGESPKTAPSFDDYMKKEVGGNTDHLSAEAWGSYRRSYDYKYHGKR